MARARLLAVALALSAAAGGCSGGESSGIEDDVAARYEAFPSDAQVAGTPKCWLTSAARSFALARVKLRSLTQKTPTCFGS